MKSKHLVIDSLILIMLLMGGCFTMSNRVKDPVFYPSPNDKYSDTIIVTITTETSDVDIRYTLDGTTPNEKSLEYMNSITISQDTTIKAIALKDSYLPSNVVYASYRFN